MPIDLSTAVLIDEKGAHKESTAVLRIFPHLSFPYNVLGRIALLLPVALRDFAYRLFAKNRGAIWRSVKRVTGLGDTHLEEYRDRIVGLEEESQPLSPGWGFK